VLRRLIEGEDQLWIAEAIQNGVEEVAWVLPELRELISRTVNPTTDSRASRYRLFDSILSLLKKLSTQRPLAIFIDDLQEADQGSLHLFKYLAAELTGTKSLLFGTFRAHGVVYQKCAAMVASVLRLREAELVTLSGLSARDVANMAESRSGARPSAIVARDILAKTNGNPFFVLQILKVLENDGILETILRDRPLEYSIPRGIRDAITRQVDVLPASVIRMLGMAAVIEKDFSISLLERALGIEASAIIESLETAVDSGICLSDDEGASYRFAHALVREAICASLTVSERARNNSRVALALEVGAGSDLGPLSADIARHFAASYPDPLAVRAIGFLILAARWDVDRAAFDSAAAHLERALILLERLCPGDKQLRCELCLERGFAYGLAGNREESRRALEEGARLAEECERPDLVARASVLFAPDLLAIETGVYDTDLVGLLESALRKLPGDAEERPRILARLAVALHWSEIPRDRIKSLVEEAAVEADSRDDVEMASFVRTAGRLALYSVECPEESIRESKSDRVEDGSTSLLRTILRITALWQVGQMRDVEIEIAGFSSLLRRARKPSAAWYVGMLKATMALMKGQYALAGELGEQFLQEGLRVDDRNALHSFALQRAMSAIDVGRLEELEPAVVEMASTFPRVEGWQAGVCYLYSELGKVEEARDVMEAAIGRGVLNSFPRNSWFGTLGSLTLACRVLESPAIVRELYARWERFAGQMAVVGFSSFCWGSTDRFLGVLAGLMCKWDVAQAHFHRAIAANKMAGAAPALAHTYADLAAMLDRNQLGVGRESWDLALQQARFLGMTNLERRILHESH
jgi:tetratricopeptide (TPR) repeat protein